MKVYKFGGASVKDAAGIINLEKIVSMEPGRLLVVLSAFGKTTNALEYVLKLWLSDDEGYKQLLDRIFNDHLAVTMDLFADPALTADKLNISFAALKEILSEGKRREYDIAYDQIVSYGEIWRTVIVGEYLQSRMSDVGWVDIRENLKTDDRYRDANILWTESSRRVNSTFDFRNCRIYVTQGFIGGTVTGDSTTLGREGSDYTAAVLANILNAESVVVWKDVPGIMNADPRWLPDAIKLDEISYREAVEMAFSGAKVIHPKTIKPLHNKNIPLYVRSFLFPGETGTVIKRDAKPGKVLPVFIKKENQILISILPKDFSFVMGDNLSRIFHSFMRHGIKVNLVEASAVSIDVCVDDERTRIEALIGDLRSEFSAVYNENVELLSIRHYTADAISGLIMNREILLEQKTRSTVRFVVRQEISKV